MKWILVIWMFDGSTFSVPTQFGDPFDSLYQCNESRIEWIKKGPKQRLQWPYGGECIPARFDE